jgi:hypothetical protein
LPLDDEIPIPLHAGQRVGQATVTEGSTGDGLAVLDQPDRPRAHDIRQELLARVPRVIGLQASLIVVSLGGEIDIAGRQIKLGAILL